MSAAPLEERRNRFRADPHLLVRANPPASEMEALTAVSVALLTIYDMHVACRWTADQMGVRLSAD